MLKLDGSLRPFALISWASIAKTASNPCSCIHRPAFLLLCFLHAAFSSQIYSLPSPGTNGLFPAYGRLHKLQGGLSHDLQYFERSSARPLPPVSLNSFLALCVLQESAWHCGQSLQYHFKLFSMNVFISRQFCGVSLTEPHTSHVGCSHEVQYSEY